MHMSRRYRRIYQYRVTVRLIIGTKALASVLAVRVGSTITKAIYSFTLASLILLHVSFSLLFSVYVFGVAFREKIFSLTMETEVVRKLKKNTAIPDGETNSKLSAIYFETPLIALRASITGAILISWPFNTTALFLVTFVDLVSPASSVSVSLETPTAFSRPSNETIFYSIETPMSVLVV